MICKEKVREELVTLVEEAGTIITKLLNKDDKEYWFRLPWNYQRWYSKAIKAVEVLAPDRYDEFRRYYEIDIKRKTLSYETYAIQDYLKGFHIVDSNRPDFDIKELVIQYIQTQLTILDGVECRLYSVLSDLEANLFIEMKDDELKSARDLIKIDTRAAGCIAGVVLEGYLKKVCLSHGIKFGNKKMTIGELNGKLKDNNVCEMDIWRKISYLGDLRNLCSHKNIKDPTKEQVIELIDGVNWVTKNVF